MMDGGKGDQYEGRAGWVYAPMWWGLARPRAVHHAGEPSFCHCYGREGRANLDWAELGSSEGNWMRTQKKGRKHRERNQNGGINGVCWAARALRW